MVTIGQLAKYAGVTIKAVRHYHQRGLLTEPPRDSSGYRRYSARHAIALVKIKALAEAGVPLARIKELLAAHPDRFAAAIAEIDRTLQERAEELLATRERIVRLCAGDRLFVSADVADYLDQLQELGVSQRTVQMERDIWILMQSVSPKEAATWIADKRDAMGDRESSTLRASGTAMACTASVSMTSGHRFSKISTPCAEAGGATCFPQSRRTASICARSAPELSGSRITF